MRKQLYIFVPGILCRPGDADGWTDRAVTWTHYRTGNYAEKFEYWAGPLTRRIRQQWRATKLAKMIGFYPAIEWDVHLVGHSNGCDVIVRALGLIARPLNELHFISPASDEHMLRCGLVDALDTGCIAKLIIYLAGKDRVLLRAKLSRHLFGRFNLGYGYLGLLSPAEIHGQEKTMAISVVSEPDYGHSTWFERGNCFESTMQILAKGGSR